MLPARLVVLLSLALLLQGCVGTGNIKSADNIASKKLYEQHLQRIAGIDQFSLQGRIGVQTDGKGFSGGISWRHNTSDDDIALYSPLGSQVASIQKTADKVTLEDANGNSISANDIETLTQTTLGWQLPLAGLSDWSLGRPSNRPVNAVNWNEKGQITHLIQDGWDIEYDDYAEFEGSELPNKLYLRSTKVNIKLIVKLRSNTN